ncbi:Carrier domain-containing protein OS=Streptomyces antimycoticus OX=68175 GN=SANT12839_008080 PE=4 SV=1 [Streptomyces antimycoticus]
MQQVAAHGTVPLDRADLGGHPPRERAEALDRTLTGELNRPYDLRQGPLTRALLIRLADQEHILLLAQHHIVTDGWSVGVWYASWPRSTPPRCPEPPPRSPNPPCSTRTSPCGSAAVPPPPGESTDLEYWRGLLAGMETAASCPPTAAPSRCAPRRARCTAVSCPPSWWRG